MKSKILWPNLLFFTITPVAALAALIYTFSGPGVSWFGLSFFVVMFFLTELGITAGYHRLFAHRTYDAHWSVKWFFLLFGAGAFQESAYRWSMDHRIHHRFVDTNRDPYSIKRGFWFAHMGWIVRESLPEATPALGSAKDLDADPSIMFQHRFYIPIASLMCFGFPALVGWAFGRTLEGFLWGGVIRMVAAHHCTFLINSAAHVFGQRPFSLKNTARDNWLLAIFTQGEGYHNFHHAFASDYRNGVYWYQWDPTKWSIYSLRCLGLVRNLRITPDWMILRARAEVHYEEIKNSNQPVPHFEEIKRLLDERIQRFAEIKKRFQEWKLAARTCALKRADRKREKRNYRAELALNKAQMMHAWAEYSRAARSVLRALPAR
jgi:stearoyl-CoA desaturase (delta-9 desaturase)